MKKRQQFSSAEEIGGIHHKKTATDSMVAKHALNKKIHEATQDAAGPKSLKQRLTGAVGKLSKEQLDGLQKQVDPSAHDKIVTEKINALKDLSAQLQDAGPTERQTPSKSPSPPPSQKSSKPYRKQERDSWRPSIACLSRNARRCATSTSQNDTFRARLATRLTQGGRGSRRANFVAEKEQSLLADVVEFADCHQHRTIHRNSGPRMAPKTKSLIDHITDYQNNSVTQISCKTNSLTESPRHAKWTGAVARVQQGACVQSPDTWQRMLVSTRCWRIPLVVHVQEPLALRSERVANAWLGRVRAIA